MSIVDSHGTLEQQLEQQRFLDKMKLQQQEDEPQEEPSQQQNHDSTTTSTDLVAINEIEREFLQQKQLDNGLLIEIYKLIYSNGDIYEGELNDNLKEGLGIYYF